MLCREAELCWYLSAPPQFQCQYHPAVAVSGGGGADRTGLFVRCDSGISDKASRHPSFPPCGRAVAGRPAGGGGVRVASLPVLVLVLVSRSLVLVVLGEGRGWGAVKGVYNGVFPAGQRAICTDRQELSR